MLDALLGAFSNFFVARCLLLLTKHGRKRAFFVSSGITTLPNAFLAVCPYAAYRMVTVVVIASSPSFVCLWASYLSFSLMYFAISSNINQAICSTIHVLCTDFSVVVESEL